jgi:hypothetical protein
MWPSLQLKQVEAAYASLRLQLEATETSARAEDVGYALLHAIFCII